MNRLVPCLLLKKGKVYRNLSWGKYFYLGNLSNILRLYSRAKATELLFIDVDNSLCSSIFREKLFQCIQQCDYPVTLYSSPEAVKNYSNELIAGGFERLGVQACVDDTNLDVLSDLVDKFGSSTITVLFNLLPENIKQSANLCSRFLPPALAKIAALEKIGIKEIVFQYIPSIGRSNGPSKDVVEAISNLSFASIIVGYHGGIRSFTDAQTLYSSGIDIACSGTYLSSAHQGSSALPYFPAQLFTDSVLSLSGESVASQSNPSDECNTCLMNSSFSGFRKIGDNCNFCLDFKLKRETVFLNQCPNIYNQFVSKVRQDGHNHQYDCVIGVSGGVDSCFVLHHAVSHGLRPVCVTMDNGLNDSTANSNIRSICSELGVPLYSHVIDWDEYSFMLRSMLNADVIDIELLYDNACQAVCYNKALEIGCKYIVSGSNTFTEGMMPPEGMSWHKNDVKNILSILYRYQLANGKQKRRPTTYPFLGFVKRAYATLFKQIKWVKYLDYIDYNKTDALALLIEKYDFVPYKQKHFENIMTRLYQGYILPHKFSCHKERWHLSMEIISGLLTKPDAYKILEEQASCDWTEDIAYVSNLLSMSSFEFKDYLSRPAVEHHRYPSDYKTIAYLGNTYKKIVNKISSQQI